MPLSNEEARRMWVESTVLSCCLFGRHTTRRQLFRGRVYIGSASCIKCATLRFAMYSEFWSIAWELPTDIRVFYVRIAGFYSFWTYKIWSESKKTVLQSVREANCFWKVASLRECRRNLVLNCIAASWNQKRHGMRSEGETIWNLSKENLVYYSLVLSISRIDTKIWSVPSLYSTQSQNKEQ